MISNKTKRLLDRIHGNVFNSDKFHEATNNTKLSHASAKQIPQSWIRINFKTYQRLTRVSFKEISLQRTSQSDLLNKRRSIRQFSGSAITKKELYYLLHQSSGLTFKWDSLDQSRRPYPSAGARYPLEVYPLVLNCDGIEEGLYHYNVKEDVLELLVNKDLKEWISSVTNGERWLERAAVIFIITGVLDRTRIKYGDRGYRYILLEAGHLGQNLCLLATELGLGTCAIGGYLDAEVNKLLDISLQKEVAMYLIAAGKI